MLTPGVRQSLTGLLLLLSICMTVNAAEYFTAPSGNDWNSGSDHLNAFLTIGKGVSVLKPGDTLTILPGDYPETVTMRQSGTAGAPITIRAQRRGTVVLRGDVDIRGFEPVKNTRYTYVLPFERSVEGVADRALHVLYKPVFSVGEVDLFVGSYFYDTEQHKLYVHASYSLHPDHRALTASVTNGIGLLLCEASGAKSIDHVIVDGLSFTGYNSRDFSHQQGSRARWGLMVRHGRHIAIRHCTAFLNGGGIQIEGMQDSVVEDCLAFSNYSRHLGLAIGGVNIAAMSCTRVSLLRNRSINGDITMYVDIRDCVSRGNLVVNGGMLFKGGVSGLDQGCNIAVGSGAYIDDRSKARPQAVLPTNLVLPNVSDEDMQELYADPINYDYRLQSDAPLRGMGEGGAEPGPFPYRDEVYFVRPQGNDAAVGTSVKQAWQTIGRAAAAAKPGDTVYILAGEYREPLVPARSGAAEQPIRFIRRGRDHVVLHGGETMETGVDLRGRSFIEIEGLTILGFKTGVIGENGQSLRVARSIVECAEGIVMSKVAGLSLEHNQIRFGEGTRIRLLSSPGALLLGNLIESGEKDNSRSMDMDECWHSLVSRSNAFVPKVLALKNTPFDAYSARTLERWNDTPGRFGDIVLAEVGRDPRDSNRLSDDSPLIGRGAHAGVVGPYLRYFGPSFVSVEDLKVHQVTPTTATIECWTPRGPSNPVMSWGVASAEENLVKLPQFAFHSASLVGLTPATTYQCKVSVPGVSTRLQFVEYAIEPRGHPFQPPVASVTFQTLTQPLPPRTLHVAVTGNDERDGSSLEQAWRTINFASSQARPGDTVLIHGGEYHESIHLRCTGEEGLPVTFQAAPGEAVWLTGSNFNRTSAFVIPGKHHLVFDGLRFKAFHNVGWSDDGDVFFIRGGSHITLRRCFYDGRGDGLWPACFVRARDTHHLLVDNCVMINGMDESLMLHGCRDVTARHCVFYIPYIRAITFWSPDADTTLTLSHNLFCETLPGKSQNAFVRLYNPGQLRSNHNGYYPRIDPDRRRLLECWSPGHVQRDLTLAQLRQETAQDQDSVIGNPGIAAAPTLLPDDARISRSNAGELHWNDKESRFDPLDFKDFFVDPQGPFARSAAGEPIGLDPAAFH